MSLGGKLPGTHPYSPLGHEPATTENPRRILACFWEGRIAVQGRPGHWHVCMHEMRAFLSHGRMHMAYFREMARVGLEWKRKWKWKWNKERKLQYTLHLTDRDMQHMIDGNEFT
jgi:hypothetical protein